MQGFVFWTGMYNLVLGCALFFPVLLRSWGVRLPDPVPWTELLACGALYFGVLLILCGRNLAARGPLVWWAGVLRLMIGALLAWCAAALQAGAVVGAAGALEILMGAVYLAALPKHLHRTHADLALDRR